MNFSNMFKGFSDLFSVDSPVSSSSFDISNDVIKTQNALSDLGHFNAQTPDIGEGLKSFQADNGLKVDGIMNPGGPTENALSQTLVAQGISNTDFLESTKSDPSSPDTRNWQASVNMETGKVTSKPVTDMSSPTPKKPTHRKIDPITGLADPLANAPKPKVNMKKAWDDFYKQQAEKTKTAIVPQGDTVDERIRSMMQDNRYRDKHDTGLRNHEVKQFERAYPGMIEYDETGKMIQAKPVISPDEVEPYDPHGELRYAQEQADQIQALSHQLPQRNQTPSTGTDDEGSRDYPQHASTQPSAQQSRDQLGADIPFNETALAEASAMNLDSKREGGYQVAQNQHGEMMSDAKQADTPYKPLSKEAIEHLANQYNDALASGDEKQIKGFQGALSAYHPDDRARIVDTYSQQFKSGNSPKLSDGATKEMGDHLARRKARAPYDEGRLDATDQAIRSTYTKEEQKRIRKHAAENPQPVMPEHHDVWRGNVHDMGQEMGLDKKLIDEAGNDAVNAMAAAISYRRIQTQEGQRNALKAIYDLEKAGHVKLARELLGKLAVSKVWPSSDKTTQSDQELRDQQANHKRLEEAVRAIGSLPKIPNPVSAVLKILENDLKQGQEKDGGELKRRKRPH